MPLKPARLLYDIFLKSYVAGIKILAQENIKAKKWLKGRGNIFLQLEKVFSEDKNNDFRVWMHCASLGEFEQGRSLLETIKNHNPEIKIILTFFSPSGYEMRKNYHYADYVFYLPMDGKKNAEQFIELVKPNLALFVKYEFWYYYFKTLAANKIPLIMLSVTLRKHQIFFKWYGALHKEMLNYVTHFFVQDDETKKLLNSLNFKNITVLPDTRIDRVYGISKQQQQIPSIEEFLNNEKAFLGGSIYAVENEMIAKAFHSGFIKEKIILVPHNVDEKSIAEILKPWGENAVRYTKHNSEDIKNKKVLIVDTIGLLSALYKYARFAFIGGGFGKGIHNTLEPAAFGVPVFFGPKHKKFPEAQALIAESAAFCITNYDDFIRSYKHISANENEYVKASAAAANYIEKNAGATGEIHIWLREKMLLP